MYGQKQDGIQRVQNNNQSIYEEKTLVLSGAGAQYYAIPTASNGFLVYQVADAASTLSGGITIDLEMSNDGSNWLKATDAAGDDITDSLSAGLSIMQKLSDVNPFVKLRLNFVTAVTGTLSISTRV